MSKRKRFNDAREGFKKALADLDKAEVEVTREAMRLSGARDRVKLYLARLDVPGKGSLLARAADLIEQVKTGARTRLLDNCGQAPCPLCEEGLTNDGKVCAECRARIVGGDL